MKPATAEWISKAEGDFATVERECRARKKPNYDGACFHAQQCAEKYMKARMCEESLSIPKTHNLVELLEKALKLEPIWDAYREDLALLSGYAVSHRYPGESASLERAKDALRRCRRFREAARLSLGLGATTKRKRSKKR
jgi:HEPN domain-containing protein